MELPKIIQGGMGVGVSDWRLARAVSRQGQLGVVSGTAINSILIRRLQAGDPGGDMRRALARFPVPEISQRLLDEYFVPGGLSNSGRYKRCTLFTAYPSPSLIQMTIAASFAEVFLAKEGHDGLVGINLLEKIQFPNLACIYGAMLAGVDFVLMGAGIPREIPGVLDRFAEHKEASIGITVAGAFGTEVRSSLNPAELMKDYGFPALRRPKFLAIISSATLAVHLARKASGKVDGFIIEGPTAGGHNAPPRGGTQLSLRGEPVYGSKDALDLEKVKSLELPFWLAGSYGTPKKLQEALEMGAAGVQVGTAFAFCEESGLTNEIKSQVFSRISQSSDEDLQSLVFTDPKASPTGFPFKVVQLAGTMSETDLYALRPRKCDLGYLREAYARGDGKIGYRCPSEPMDDFEKKAGCALEAVGRKCLCNGLMANIGLAQEQESGYLELPILTAGDDMAGLRALLRDDGSPYSAEEVIGYLFGTA